MGGYSAEIRSRKATEGDGAADLGHAVVAHHLTESAQISLERPTGGHLLHLAVAGCVYNTIHRFADDRGVELTDCRVSVDGGFAEKPPRSTGIEYDVELAGNAPDAELESIAREADADSTIPNVLRASTSVALRRVETRGSG